MELQEAKTEPSTGRELSSPVRSGEISFPLSRDGRSDLVVPGMAHRRGLVPGSGDGDGGGTGQYRPHSSVMDMMMAHRWWDGGSSSVGLWWSRWVRGLELG